MISEELIPLIQEKFRKGQRRAEIKEDLLYAGYLEEDIDETIAHIQHTALKQLPIIASIYKLIEDFESKNTLATPQMTALLMVTCVVFLIALAGGMYLFFDPLGTRSAARDAQRSADEAVLQKAIAAYYQKNYLYPNSLSNLVPEFLPSLPHDPSGAAYFYKPLDVNNNYQLCITYEDQVPQCVSAIPVSNDIPLIPTETPVPQFEPQAASGAGNIQ